MNPTRVLLPVALFIAFASANYLASRQTLESIDLTAADEDLRAGTQLTDARLAKVTVFGSTTLFRTFVPFGNRGKDLLFAPINRDVKKGELIALSDLMQPAASSLQLGPDEVGVHVSLDQLQFAEGQLSIGIEVGFILEKSANEATDYARVKKWTVDPVPLGPFRIVGIGDHVLASRQARDDSSGTERKLVTIAARLGNNGALEEKAARLVAASADSQADGAERIRALVILPPRSAGDAAKPAVAAKPADPASKP